jgi:hypothetical protein
MPPFSHLRPDYPLYLTLFDRVHECALTRFYIAGLTSCRPIRISPLRHNGPAPVSFYPRSCANSRSFAFAPCASKSTCGLTPARASLREFRLYIDEQLTTPSNTDMRRRAATLNSISCGCWLRCSANRCHVSFVGFRFQVRNGTEECTSAPSLVSRCRGHRSKSSQIRRNT